MIPRSSAWIGVLVRRVMKATPFFQPRTLFALRFIFIFVMLFGSVFPLVSEAASISKSIISPQRKRPSKEEPIHLTSDTLEYRKDEDLFIAEGSVVMIQGPMRVEADYATLDNQSGKLLATGNVHFSDGENQIDANQVEIDVDTQLGIMYDARLFIKSEHYTIDGEEMERRDIDRYFLKDASFTACDCVEDPDWRIRASQIRVHLDNFLVMRNFVFYADEIPILYLPYFIYPAKTERQTGFLVPRVGYSSRWGFRYYQDFFWAISKSQDMTFSLDHRGNKGDGGALQYRYVLSKDAQGRLDIHYFHDRIDRTDRDEVQYIHQQRFTDRITGKIDVHYVNQQNNFQVLSDSTTQRAQTNVESNVFLTYRGDESYAYLLGRYTQTLTGQSNSTVAQRLPEIGYSFLNHRIDETPLYFNWESTATNFWREVGPDVKRVDLYPKLSMPISLSAAGTLTPWTGFRETWYSRGETDTQAIEREIYPIGLDWEDRLQRAWGGFTHLVVPSLMYERIAVGDHPDVPQFDEIDRLHDRNNLTASVAQRFFTRNEKGEAQEKVYLRFTDTYNLRDEQPGVTGTHPFSDLRAEGIFHYTSHFTLAIDSFYDPYRHLFSSWNTDVTLNFPPRLAITLGQRATKEGTIPQKGDLFNPLFLGDRETTPRINFLTEHIVLRTPAGINLASKAYFDVTEKKFTEIDYGVQLERQCWSISLVYIILRSPSVPQLNRSEFLFLLNLKGLGASDTKKFVNIF